MTRRAHAASTERRGTFRSVGAMMRPRGAESVPSTLGVGRYGRDPIRIDGKRATEISKKKIEILRSRDYAGVGPYGITQTHGNTTDGKKPETLVTRPQL